MKVLGISGKAQHGKDLTAQILKEKLERKNKTVLLIHYADFLKHIAKQYFNWDGNKDINGRTLLQNIGETARKVNKNYWVKIVYDFVITFCNNYDYVIIADCRHQNEYQYLIDKELDLITIRINRSDFENSLTEEQRNHISETALDDYNFDYILTPKNNIDSLIKCVDNLLKDI